MCSQLLATTTSWMHQHNVALTCWQFSTGPDTHVNLSELLQNSWSEAESILNTAGAKWVKRTSGNVCSRGVWIQCLSWPNISHLWQGKKMDLMENFGRCLWPWWTIICEKKVHCALQSSKIRTRCSPNLQPMQIAPTLMLPTCNRLTLLRDKNVTRQIGYFSNPTLKVPGLVLLHRRVWWMKMRWNSKCWPLPIMVTYNNKNKNRS